MTDPVFDANGWCSDMTLAPRDASQILVQPSGGYDVQVARWYCPTVDETDDGWWETDSHFWHSNDITHWKRFGSGPVGT